jgi:Cof subfamily protein (haloacid dehalogenase superfamily)
VSRQNAGVLPRLIATDLDGTLLRPDGTLSARTAAALQAVAAHGTFVVFATGRPPTVAAQEIQAAGGGVHYGVMANGTIVCRLPEGDVLRSVSFDASTAREAIIALRSHDPALGFALATDVGFSAEHGFHARMPAHPVAAGPEVRDALAGHEDASEAIKLLAFHPDHDAHELTEKLPALLGGGLVVSHMGADAVEIAPAGADKGVGLRWLCEHLGVARHEVAVFGDEVNDLPMFSVAGIRVAVANANAAVIAAADEVTASNADDGVAETLERWLSTVGR